MSARTKAVLLVILAVPCALAAMQASSFRVHNRNNGTLLVAGERREYLLYVPPGYDASKPTPLVISMHGAGGWPALQRDISLWNRVADREGFLVVYPGGFTRGTRVWRVSRDPAARRDVEFIAKLIDHLRASYNIDSARIYANGLSNGGGMAFVLSCELADRIAAVGMVGAAHTLPFTWCHGDRPVPMIAFHGTADPVTPYEGGQTWIGPRAFPSIPRFTESWARKNGCAPVPVDSAVTPAVTRREYARCASNASVVLYTLRGAGHTWPGGAPLPEWFMGPTSDFDASSEMWAFFEKHPM